MKTLIRSGKVVIALMIAVGSATWLDARMPLLEGLGSHSHPVTTKSAGAQKYFDQGLKLMFGFNHGAAIRSFKEAAKPDPECAMAHWGIALANGPHINLPVMTPPMVEEAWAELQLAKKHAANATAIEQALIEALGHRYANPQPEDRAPLDLAYADAMREVWQKHPDNPDVGVLFAEALDAQGKEAEAAAVRERFKKVWAKADVEIRSSCYCQPGA